MTLRQEFATRLRFVREMREMTQAQLAAASDINPSVIAHFESGKRAPGIENLKAIAKAAMVSSDYLLGLTERVGP